MLTVGGGDAGTATDTGVMEGTMQGAELREQKGKGSRWMILFSSNGRDLTEGYRSSLSAFKGAAVGEVEHAQ